MTAKNHFKKIGAWVIAIAMTASLLSCGGSDSLLSYRDQTLQWAPCDASL